MGQAAVISLAEAVQVKRRRTVRVHLHRILDHVMSEVETELSTEQPTLEQITQAVLEQRQALTQARRKSSW